MKYSSIARYYVSSKSSDFKEVNNILACISKLLNWDGISDKGMFYNYIIKDGLEFSNLSVEDRNIASDFINSGWEVLIKAVHFQSDTVLEVTFEYHQLDAYGSYEEVDYEYRFVNEFLNKYNLLELLIKVYDCRLSVESYWDCISLASSGTNKDNILDRGGKTPKSCMYSYAIQGYLKYPTNISNGTSNGEVSDIKDTYLKVFLNSKYVSNRWNADEDLCCCTYYLTDDVAFRLFKDIICSELLDKGCRLDSQTAEGMSISEMYDYLVNTIDNDGLLDSFSIKVYSLLGD